ncbi:MAG TPA: hypothetical protein VFC54_03650 [Pseudolabrys sp.]|nr:hypothetical protein [Pseudolabrys sp.]
MHWFRDFSEYLHGIFGDDAADTIKAIELLLAPVITFALVVAGVFGRGWHKIFSGTAENRNFRIHPARSRQEIQAIYEFDEEAYGHGENISKELFYEWWNAYRDGFIAAYQNGNPVAVVGFFPVTEAFYQLLLSGKVSERDLTGEIIGKADGTHWYLSGISVKNRKKSLSRVLGRLICQSAQLWYDKHGEALVKKSINIVSVGTTKEGRDILEDLRFSPGKTDDDGSDPIYSREVTRDRLLSFMIESPYCKGCLDPMLPPKGAGQSAD